MQDSSNDILMKNKLLDLLNKEEFLGISELTLRLTDIANNKEEKKKEKINLHYLFSFHDSRLYCRCLDFDIYVSLDLKSKLENISIENLSDKEFLHAFAEDLINKILDLLLSNIINHLSMKKKNGNKIFMCFSGEHYWREFRNLRENVTNNNIHKIFYNKELEDFVDLEKAIIDKLKNIKLDELELNLTKQYLFINYFFIYEKIHELSK